MAGTLAQSAVLPSRVISHGQIQSSKRSKQVTKMMRKMQSRSSTIGSFTGLRQQIGIDMGVRPAKDFHGFVAAAVSFVQVKANRGVVVCMFERFTEEAINVILLSQEEARRLGHNFVGTDQILLGLIGEGTGVAAKVLKSMGINLEEARIEVEKIIGLGSGFVPVEIPSTPRAKRALERSLEEARQLGHNYIGSEHLLLGLLHEDNGVVAQVLENLGVDPSNIRTQSM